MMIAEPMKRLRETRCEGRERSCAASSGHCKSAMHRLLPHMTEHAGRKGTLLFLCEGRGREGHENLVEDGCFHHGFCLLLLPKPIEFRYLGLDGCEQFSARLLDPFTIGFAQSILLQ